MAYLSSLITNLAISIHGKKGSKPTNVIDFMPKWDADEQKEQLLKKQSIEEMKEAMQNIAKAFSKNKGKEKLPSFKTGEGNGRIRGIDSKD